MMVEGCKECEKDRQAYLEAEGRRVASGASSYVVLGVRNAGKLGPISQMLAEEEMRKWEHEYEKRHGHRYPDIMPYGANDEESMTWLRGQP